MADFESPCLKVRQNSGGFEADCGRLFVGITPGPKQNKLKKDNQKAYSPDTATALNVSKKKKKLKNMDSGAHSRVATLIQPSFKKKNVSSALCWGVGSSFQLFSINFTLLCLLPFINFVYLSKKKMFSGQWVVCCRACVKSTLFVIGRKSRFSFPPCSHSCKSMKCSLGFDIQTKTKKTKKMVLPKSCQGPVRALSIGGGVSF